MMSFPFSYGVKKSIPVVENQSGLPEQFLKNASETFESIESVTYKQVNNAIQFSGDMFRFAWNGYNFLNGVTKGRLSVEQFNGKIVIKHRIYFTEFFLISLFFSIIPIALLSYNQQWSLNISLVIWLGFYGGNFLLSAFRFNLFVKHTYKKLVKKLSDEAKEI